MTLPVASVDNDDVLVAFNRRFIPYMNGILGTNLTYEGFYSYDFRVMYPQVPWEKMLKHVERFCHTIHHEIEPEEGAVEGMAIVRELFATHLNTSRCESTWDVTLGLLSQHGFDPLDGHHFTNGVSVKYPERRRAKSQVCTEIGAVVHVEDSAQHANEVAEALGISVIMPIRPWNMNEELVSGVIPSRSWSETVDLLGKIHSELARG
tara:strand:- start:1586 stop:2206 length:621 start_codon:yes stop_codon:yes gene_type:complete